MLEGLQTVEGGDSALPFVLQFHGSASSSLSKDQEGTVHTILQAEGGEQGDPLMPALFSLGQHPALLAVQAQLEDGERLFAFLDDAYVVCSPARVNAIYGLLQNALFAHSSIRVHNGKTQVWNRGGVVPVGIEVLQAVARVNNPDVIPHCTVRSKACGFWALRWATPSSCVLSWRGCLRRTIS